MNVLGCRDVDEIVFDAPFVITEQMLSFLKIDLVVEPSLDIDYPKDSADPFEYVRTVNSKDQTIGDKLVDKLSALTKPKEKEQRQVELVKVNLPKDEVLQSQELMNRITKNRDVYEARNKNKD